MKILMLTQYYPPEHGAPQNRIHDLTRRWSAKGVETRVLTAMPNYPGGQIFPGYKGAFARSESMDGIDVRRSWIWPTKSRGVARQLAAYFSFTASSLLYGAFALGRHDFLICESPPLFLGGSALLLALRTRARLVMNISDLWPESAVQMGIIGPGLALSALEKFEEILYRRSALVTCQTDGIAAGVLKRCPSANIFLFPNGIDPDMFKPVPRDSALAVRLGLPSGKFIVGYGGNHGRAQGLRVILDAAEILRDKPFAFVLLGDGAEKDELIAEAARRNLSNVHFKPSAPRMEMAAIQALWDAAVVPLRNLPLFDGARPSKMFELMAGGIPFVFCGKGEGADIARRSGCATVVPPESPEELASALESMAALPAEERSRMGRSGAKFVLDGFDRSKLSDTLLSKLTSISNK